MNEQYKEYFEISFWLFFFSIPLFLFSYSLKSYLVAFIPIVLFVLGIYFLKLGFVERKNYKAQNTSEEKKNDSQLE